MPVARERIDRVLRAAQPGIAPDLTDGFVRAARPSFRPPAPEAVFGNPLRESASAQAGSRIETTTLAHCDAVGREPSTASITEVASHNSDVR